MLLGCNHELVGCDRACLVAVELRKGSSQARTQDKFNLLLVSSLAEAAGLLANSITSALHV